MRLVPLLLACAALAQGPSLRNHNARAVGTRRPPPPKSVEAALRRAAGQLTGLSRPRQALFQLLRAREQFNDAPGLAAATAVACGSVGNLGCVIEASDSEPATGVLANRDHRARAYALRYLGDGASAAALRRENLLTASFSPSQRAYAWAMIGEDLRLAGDVAGAWDAAAAAASEDPTSEALHALEMELALDAGDLDGALIEAALADRDGATGVLMTAAQMRVALQADAPFDVLDAGLRHTGWGGHPPFAVRLFLVYRRVGMHERARGVFDSTLFLWDDQLWWPQLLALSALNHLDLGDPRAASRDLSRAVEIAPNNDVVKAVVEACAPTVVPLPFGRQAG